MILEIGDTAAGRMMTSSPSNRTHNVCRYQKKKKRANSSSSSYASQLLCSPSTRRLILIYTLFVCALCQGHAEEQQQRNYRVLLEDDGIIFCPEDIHECPDGSFVSRNPNDDCNFTPCGSSQEGDSLLKEESYEEEGPTLIDDGDMFRCPDGSREPCTDKEEDNNDVVTPKIDISDIDAEDKKNEEFIEGGENNDDETKALLDNDNSELYDQLLEEQQNQEQDMDGEGEGEKVSVLEASDSSVMEETDVQEVAGELLIEAEESDMERLSDEGGDSESSASGGRTKQEEDSSSASKLTSSNTISYYPDSHRSAWVAHGTVGALIFGLFIPTSISSALFRDQIPTYWIYLHVCLNVIVFAMTFFTVGIAFATMNGMGTASEGHFKEMHHIIGLLLLMLVSWQTANGFLRPPREFVTDDEQDTTPGAIIRSTIQDRSMTARTLWYLAHCLSGLCIFSLGIYQVKTGLQLFSMRYGTADWGLVYIGYISWLVGVIIVAKLYMKWKERKTNKKNTGLEMGRGSNIYDQDLTNAQFESVESQRNSNLEW